MIIILNIIIILVVITNLILTYQNRKALDSILQFSGTSIKDEASLCNKGTDGTGFFKPDYNDDEVMSESEKDEFDFAIENGYLEDNK